MSMLEKAAQAIYEEYTFGLEGMPAYDKPAWVPNGNSLKQDEARRYASITLKLVQHAIDANCQSR